mgnify:CR=1 FL=1
MSTPRNASSAFVGTAWFAVLLGACMYAEKWDPGSFATQASIDAEPPAKQTTSETEDVDTPRATTDIDNLLNSRLNRPAQPLSEVISPEIAEESTPSPVARPLVPASQPDRRRPLESPAPNEPQSPTKATETRKLVAPILPAPPGLIAPELLHLAVDPPDVLLQHEPAPLLIRITNNSTAPATGVTVRVEFGDAWEFSDSEEHSIEQRLSDIPPTASREVSLSLVPLHAGTCPLDFEVESDTHPLSSQTIPLDVSPRIVDLKLVGPRRQSLGQRAEFIATLVNTSDADLPETRAEIAYDPNCLTVREASVGWTSESPGTIAWPLGTLLHDERVQIQLEFECTAETLQSLLRCAFESAGQPVNSSEARLEIIPARPLVVTIVDDNDPQTVGESARFRVQLRNQTGSPLSDIALRISTSPHFDGLELAGNSGLLSESITKDAYGIDLHGLSLPIDGDMELAASARTTLPGDGMLRVLIRAPGLPAPFEVEESFVVSPSIP